MMKYILKDNKWKTLLASVSLLMVAGLIPSFQSVADAADYPEQIVRVQGTSVAGTMKAANSGPVRQYNISAAAAEGVIDQWLYTYFPDKPAGNVDSYVQPSTESYFARNPVTGQGFTVVNKRIQDTLPIFESFWIRSYVKDGLNDTVVAFDYPVNYATTAGVDGTESVSLPDHWRMISVPLQPADSTPSNYSNFLFEKWTNTLSAPYGFFSTSDADLQFWPGRGYWATTKALPSPPQTLTFTGSITPVNHIFIGTDADIDQYGLQIPPKAGDNVGDYMIGNPYEVSHPFRKIWFEINVDQGVYDALQLGKTASGINCEGLENVQTWNIGMTLSDAAGTRIDAGNAAGVIESGNDLHTLFSAEDMVAPKDDYIRLSFKNPEDANNPLCYDYRAPGLDKYEWTIELSTTISSIATKLSLDNFKSIPSWYTITLTDTETGKVYSLTSDSTIDVALSSGAPRTYMLTAARQKPAAVSETAPVALALKNIYPNPFNPSTTISFDINKAGLVKLNVYNVSGQLVDTLVNGAMQAGSHQVVWNASKHSSGVYLVKMTCNGFTETRKVTFMK